MAAYGGGDLATGTGFLTTLETAAINVTGTDLCLVVGAMHDSGAQREHTFAWDPAGNDEAMTGTFAEVNQGAYYRMALEYLDNPTAANSTVEVTIPIAEEGLTVFGAFFTAAADIVGTDTDNYTGGGTSISSTVPNVTTGDMVVDMVAASNASPPTFTEGANQTVREAIDASAFSRVAFSTQEGANGGTMSWTSSGSAYGSIQIAGRIPDAGGGGGGPTVSPSGRQTTDAQFSPIDASSLGGVLQ